ncbi:MAG: hypothetical protein A2Y33_12005 [Spirochaetes bacterium GWF1_51_8]|nr:MAG: hypothetical protein A2Y33_12005 [Spirochaetes bacterium GWF1_51_8]
MAEFIASIPEFFAKLRLFQNPYFQFLIVIVASLATAKLLEVSVAGRRPKGLTDNPVFREMIRGYLTRNLLIIGLLVGILFILDLLKLDFHWLNAIQAMMISVILLICFFLVRKLIRAIMITLHNTKDKRVIRLTRNRNVLDLLQRLLEATMFVLFFTLTLGSWGIQLTPILTGLGIAGIAIGFAVQDSLSNILGGVSLMLDNTYSEGDFVELDNGSIGTIYAIGYRSSKILTFNNEIIIVPNGQFAKMMVKNLSKPDEMYRLNLIISAAYGSDPRHVQKVLLEAAKNTEGVLDSPEAFAFLEKMADFSLNYRLIVSIGTAFQRLVITDLLHKNIIDAFEREKIKIPFPTRTVYLQK